MTHVASLELELIQVMNKLESVMGAERHLLQSKNRESIGRLIDEKQSLTDRYVRCAEYWRQRGGHRVASQPLKDAFHKMHEEIEKNETLVRVALQATGGFLEALLEAASDAEGRVKTYNAQGKIPRSQRRKAPSSLPLSQDKTF